MDGLLKDEAVRMDGVFRTSRLADKLLLIFELSGGQQHGFVLLV